MTPLYALHKDGEGRVLTAGSFDYSYKLSDWLRSLDIRAGDKIEFGDVLKREVEQSPTLEVAA